MDGERSQRTQAAHELARQLGRVLAAHRLYPDDPEQAGFVAAVERVQDAAQVALAVGTVRFEVRSGALYHDNEPLSSNEQVERLAVECFERRVEELAVRSLPDARDLAELARVLTLPAGEVAERGGVQVLLDAAGVWSILAGEIRPDPEERAALLSELPPELARLYDSLDDPQRLVSNLLVGGLPESSAQAAQDLYGRFGSLHDALPADVIGRTGTLRRMRQVLDLLPDNLRREFFATVVTNVGTGGFATNYANHLTDPELVDHVLRLGGNGGPDVSELAGALVSGTGRPGTVFLMLADRLRLREEGDEGAAPGSLAAIGEERDPSAVKSAVADALGNRLVDEASGDLRLLRDLYPSDASDLKVIARFAFRDYLHVETQVERLERALASWTTASREALQRGQRERLADLMGLLDVEEPTPEKEAVFTRARHAVVSPGVVAELVDPSEDIEPLIELLEPFGRGALAAVLDVLTEEEDQARRAHLVALATGLASEDRLDELLRRLDDERWFVTRNLVTILGRLAAPEAADALIELTGHREAAVRREVVRALVRTAGADAVVHLRRAASDPDPTVRHAAMGALPGIRDDAAARALADVARHAEDQEDQQRAIQLLAAHTSPVRVELLRELASRRSKPRLPRALRKKAKAAAQDAEPTS